jgi:hypothetical protein
MQGDTSSTYQAPRLRNYGQMTAITRGGGSMPAPDGASGMAMAPMA